MDVFFSDNFTSNTCKFSKKTQATIIQVFLHINNDYEEYYKYGFFLRNAANEGANANDFKFNHSLRTLAQGKE